MHQKNTSSNEIKNIRIQLCLSIYLSIYETKKIVLAQLKMKYKYN